MLLTLSGWTSTVGEGGQRKDHLEDIAQHSGSPSQPWSEKCHFRHKDGASCNRSATYKCPGSQKIWYKRTTCTSHRNTLWMLGQGHMQKWSNFDTIRGVCTSIYWCFICKYAVKSNPHMLHTVVLLHRSSGFLRNPQPAQFLSVPH